MFELLIENLKHRGFCEGVLQGFESGNLLVAPLEQYILARQVHQWSGNNNKSFDESSVEVGES